MVLKKQLEDFWYRRLNRPQQLHIGYQTNEQGSPLLLLHGLGSSGLTWRYLAKQAAPAWHATAPDLLGFGNSPKPEWMDYTVDDHARAVAKLIRREYGLKPVTIIAHSMGCLVAIKLATTYPRRVARLILYEPPLLTPEEAKALRNKTRQTSYRQLYSWIAGRLQLMFAYSRFLAKLAIEDSPFRVAADNWLPLERTLRNTIIKQDALAELETLTTQTDIAFGQFDFIVDSKSARRRLKSNPNIHFHRINDSHGVTRVSSAQLLKILNRPGQTETTDPA